jgi:hypothetical protein
MKMLAWVLAIAVLLAGAVVIWIGLPRGPKLEDVAHLAEPRLVRLPSQRVLVVRAVGDPNEVGKAAFGLLMNTYMKLPGVPKWGPEMKAPRARWPLDPDVPVNQWVGHYAMVIPDSISTLPESSPAEALTVEITTWAYGEVAEILHVGPYQLEEPTIDRLRSFVQDQGLQIAGDHEEEYLRGPGLIFRGNPEKYLTLIRYPVRRSEESR